MTFPHGSLARHIALGGGVVLIAACSDGITGPGNTRTVHPAVPGAAADLETCIVVDGQLYCYPTNVPATVPDTTTTV